MPGRLNANGVAIAMCLSVISAISLSCSDKKPTTPEPTVTEVHAPWDNEEAEEMAVVMGGELAAPAGLYEQVKSDLDAIRSEWSERVEPVAEISHSPNWRTGEVEIAVDAETYAAIKLGFPPNWDSLNQALRIDRATLHDSTQSLTISFDARLSPQPLARLYAGLPGVRWTKMVPTQILGPASVDGCVSGNSRLYVFSQTLPGCAKLCEQADLWLFRVTGAEVDSIGAWTSGNPAPDLDSAAWADFMKVKVLALGPGSIGDFPDSDLVAPAIVGAIEGISPTSRSLLVHWISTGDDGATGIASGYEISVTGPGVGGRLFAGETLPRRAGQPESLLVENLLPDLSYRVVVRAVDEQGNWSPWSPNAFIRSLPPWASFTSQNSGLSNSVINALAIDQDSRLWCATNGGGINRFDGRNWTVIFTVADRSVINSRAMTFDSGREIVWCAAAFGALCGIRLNSSSQLSFSSNEIGFQGLSVVTIQTGANGDIWCSDAASGASSWDGSTWTVYNTTNSGLPNNVVWDIAAAPNGDMWFGTNGGASRFDGANWTNYTTANSDIGVNVIRTIAVDANGVVWCGHHDKSIGLSIFDGVIWRTQGHADSLPSTYINAIAFSAPGDAWLGTTLGLAAPGNPWKSFLTDNSPIIDNGINALAFTADAILWIGTTKGLSRYELPIGN